jgi:hypothetical protein
MAAFQDLRFTLSPASDNVQMDIRVDVYDKRFLMKP